MFVSTALVIGVLYCAIGYVVLDHLVHRTTRNPLDWPFFGTILLWPVGVACILLEHFNPEEL